MPRITVQLRIDNARQAAVVAILPDNCHPSSLSLSLFITSPAEAVAKYRDEHVCVCMCVCVCLSVSLSARISSEPHARSSPIFLCVLPMAVALPSSGRTTKSQEEGAFSPLTMHCTMYSIAFGIHKTAESVEMPFGMITRVPCVKPWFHVKIKLFYRISDPSCRHRSTVLIMAALCNRAGHYILALWFLSSSFFLSSFPRLISAVRDWISTILPHMVWP